MNKSVTILSLSLLLSTAAYAGKIGPKTQKESEKEVLTQTTETQQKESTSQESEKTEKPSISWWDKVKNVRKNVLDRAIVYIKEGKLDLQNEDDYKWLATTILYYTDNPNPVSTKKIMTLCTILKQKNLTLKENLNKVLAVFFQEQEKQKRKQMQQNLVSLLKQMKPILSKIDDALESDLDAIKELNLATLLVANKEMSVLSDETIYQQEKITSLIENLADLQ